MKEQVHNLLCVGVGLGNCYVFVADVFNHPLLIRICNSLELQKFLVSIDVVHLLYELQKFLELQWLLSLGESKLYFSSLVSSVLKIFISSSQFYPIKSPGRKLFFQ